MSTVQSINILYRNDSFIFLISSNKNLQHCKWCSYTKNKLVHTLKGTFWRQRNVHNFKLCQGLALERTYRMEKTIKYVKIPHFIGTDGSYVSMKNASSFIVGG